MHRTRVSRRRGISMDDMRASVAHPPDQQPTRLSRWPVRCSLQAALSHLPGDSGATTAKDASQWCLDGPLYRGLQFHLTICPRPMLSSEAGEGYSGWAVSAASISCLPDTRRHGASSAILLGCTKNFVQEGSAQQVPHTLARSAELRCLPQMTTSSQGRR